MPRRLTRLDILPDDLLVAVADFAEAVDEAEHLPDDLLVDEADFCQDVKFAWRPSSCRRGDSSTHGYY